jgi:hypothetical protein
MGCQLRRIPTASTLMVQSGIDLPNPCKHDYRESNHFTFIWTGETAPAPKANSNHNSMGIFGRIYRKEVRAFGKIYGMQLTVRGTWREQSKWQVSWKRSEREKREKKRADSNLQSSFPREELFWETIWQTKMPRITPEPLSSTPNLY